MNPDYTVRLEQVFQGPMDLLLHLVKEQEVEIQDVEITRVIDGYFKYLKALEAMDIELAGEFLVMAATLMSIKSRSLLPREEVELEDDLDPQDELIQRLIEYRRFKGAADDLGDRYQRRSLEHARGFQNEARMHEPERQLDLGELTAWDLLATFSRLMRETLAGRVHTIEGDPRPLRWYVSTMALAMKHHRRIALRDLMDVFGDDVPTKQSLIGAFCALLELIKIGVLGAVQTHQDDEIDLILKGGDGDFDELINASTFMDEEEDEDDVLVSPEDADDDLDESSETTSAEHTTTPDDEDEDDDLGLDPSFDLPPERVSSPERANETEAQAAAEPDSDEADEDAPDAEPAFGATVSPNGTPNGTLRPVSSAADAPAADVENAEPGPRSVHGPNV
tara:strand:- start:5550 stop:6728 length:1179 start_codon:yes stop_codon:yes gene_type:complete